MTAGCVGLGRGDDVGSGGGYLPVKTLFARHGSGGTAFLFAVSAEAAVVGSRIENSMPCGNVKYGRPAAGGSEQDLDPRVAIQRDPRLARLGRQSVP